MTIQQILQDKNMLKYMAPLDRELLLSYVLKKPRAYLFAYPEKKLTKKQTVIFNNSMKRRVRGKPIAFITGKKEFYGLEFSVNRNVLIPRPETELLVELVLKNIQNTCLAGRRAKYKIRNTSIIDIGTGSGNIIISIMKNLPPKIRKKINFYATDISSEALDVARKNVKKHKIKKTIKFIKSDLLQYFLERKIKFENLLIVANLPYVMEKIYRKNKKGLAYEPKQALFSRRKGLEHYFRFFKQIKKFLTKRYVLRVMCFVELSPEQKNPLSRIIKKNFPPAKLAFLRDLSRRKRVAVVDIGGN